MPTGAIEAVRKINWPVLIKIANLCTLHCAHYTSLVAREVMTLFQEEYFQQFTNSKCKLCNHWTLIKLIIFNYILLFNRKSPWTANERFCNEISQWFDKNPINLPYSMSMKEHLLNCSIQHEKVAASDPN